MAISLSTFDTVLHDIDPVKHPRWSFLQIFAKKHHLRCVSNYLPHLLMATDYFTQFRSD